MSNYRDDLFRKYLEESKPAEPQTVRQVPDFAILQNFFTPVYETLDYLRAKNVMLPAISATSVERLVPSGTELKESIARRQATPLLQLALTDTLQLSVVIASRADNPMSLRWRCRTTCIGTPMDSALLGTRQGVSEWLMRTILECAVRTDGVPVNSDTEQSQPHVDADYRDIML